MERTNFCMQCRRNTTYNLQKKIFTKIIKDKEYSFSITSAVCSECGGEVGVPGIMDRNVQEMDEQYRIYEGIVSVEDIEKLMKIYKLGKAPLSLALGFGEITVTRYLDGQIPSKEYSDIMRRALTSPSYMKGLLERNREKLADAAYNKAVTAANQLENMFSVSGKMLQVISYVFKRLEEVTPLSLQKLLYFIQGVSYAVCGKPMFDEKCEAWAHGPVYPEVYYLFRNFKYNPIEDARFAVLEGDTAELSDDERKAIELVTRTFGMYGGKVLERITHNEEPWKAARKGYADGIPSREPLLNDNIRKYYESLKKQYCIDTEEGLNMYIRDMLNKAS